MRLQKWLASFAFVCAASLITTTIPVDATQAFRSGPTIPFLKGSGWVPQGLTYLPSKSWTLHSYFWDRGKGPEGNASAIAVSRSSSPYKIVSLYESKSKKHFGHVGGITVSKKYLWVASTTQGKSLLLQYSINDLINARNGGKIVAKKIYNPSHATSYVTYNKSKNKLCIGKWEPKVNGKLYCHRLDRKEKLSSSFETYQTPPNVQGVEFHNGFVFYSRSYGRKIDSTVDVYRGLGNDTLVKRHTINVMAEELVKIGNNLYVTFESGAQKYHAGSKQQTYNLYYANIFSLI